ncbi:chemotaxis protein CheD [Leptospira sp. 96542]|nr:chemotaxis protein CheD [Leptospira sp. 96542]
MEIPDSIIDYYLNPGDFYFGGPNIRIRTLLGSCVSIILWNPEAKLGGMCHYILPLQNGNFRDSTLNGKYGEDAISLFLKEIKTKRLDPKSFKARIFGGSNMFLTHEKELLDDKLAGQIGSRNSDFAINELKKLGIKILSKDIGGIQSRKIYFSVWDGEVWVEKK